MEQSRDCGCAGGCSSSSVINPVLINYRLMTDADAAVNARPPTVGGGGDIESVYLMHG